MRLPIRPTFRAKLLGIVGVATLAFTGLVAAGVLLGARVERQLVTIAGRYVPRLELQPQLDSELAQMTRGFQDAVTINDADELKVAAQAKSRFLERLGAAGAAVDPVAAEHLGAALNDYEAAARDVSRRLIAAETGEGVVAAAADMQEKRERVVGLIKSAAALDRHALAEAFAASSRNVATARTLQLWIGVGCLVIVVLLSLGLSRSVLSTVAALADGLARFGQGDFRKPIRVSTHDELGDVAAHANRMAANLERLSVERAGVEAALKAANRELEAFSYSVAHDLRAPLRGINGFSRALLEDYKDKLDDVGQQYLDRIAGAAERMGQLIDALLALSRLSRADLTREPVNLSRVAAAIVEQLRSSQPERNVEFVNQAGVVAHGDPPLLRAVLENLLSNAWKFTSKRASARISFSAEPAERPHGEPVYCVRDNGAGFDMAYVEKLFAPFQRLHTSTQFAGTGVGLATVQRIVLRHGGRIWAEGAVDQGATLRFTLPEPTKGTLS
jgi:signal transduction histidine kinase